MTKKTFDLHCERCVRLADYLSDVREEYPRYHARPVAPFGVADPALLIVGLAPGFHGANASGRPFTGDHAGLLLYETLYQFGFSNQPESTAIDDGLTLKHCRITNAVKCLPPQNKPKGDEVRQCNTYLKNEIAKLKSGAVVLALGAIAHNAVLRAVGVKAAVAKFSHGEVHALPAEKWLIDSYHCSRYNTQTRRLTTSMFHQVFESIVALLIKNGRLSSA